MDAKEQMKFVNEIACDIIRNLGVLTNQGVISFDDSMAIMKIIHDKQIKWMEKKFSSREIYDFVNEVN